MKYKVGDVIKDTRKNFHKDFFKVLEIYNNHPIYDDGYKLLQIKKNYTFNYTLHLDWLYENTKMANKIERILYG